MPKRKYLRSASRPPGAEEDPAWQPPLPAEEEEEKVCAICGRPLAGICNRHHLIPLSRGGRGTTTLLLHKICHDKIHSVLPESELKRYYHTIERLREHEEIAAFIKWVQKKEPEFYDRSVRSWERRET
jgi:5-methylcytosine-specific restriction endonuclease McrA